MVDYTSQYVSALMGVCVISYSLDFRHRVVSRVKEGRFEVETRQIFGIERPMLYHWLSAKGLSSYDWKNHRLKPDI